MSWRRYVPGHELTVFSEVKAGTCLSPRYGQVVDESTSSLTRPATFASSREAELARGWASDGASLAFATPRTAS